MVMVRVQKGSACWVPRYTSREKAKGSDEGGGFLLVKQPWDPRLGGRERRCHNGQGKDRKEGFLEAKGNELGKSDPKMEREK